MNNNRNRIQWITAVLCGFLLLTSCNSSRFLPSEESLIENTKIIFKSKNKVKDESKLREELLTFITVEPNHKLLFVIPKEYLYMANADTLQQKWYNKAMRSFGEPPSVYNEGEARNIAKNMENYLKFKKGYYEAVVDFIVDENQYGWTTSSHSEVWNTSVIKFIVSTGSRYTIKSLTYESSDTSILKFIKDRQNDALIKPGDFVDYNTLEFEKSRLTLELQNNGYINFSNNYFEILGDSNKLKKEIDLFFEIREPAPNTPHHRYRAGDIHVFTDYFNDQRLQDMTQDTLDNKVFFKQSENFIVNKKILNKSIYLKSGKLLSREDRQKTFRKLNGLGSYRFITINAIPDKQEDSLMHFDILLSPFTKKWTWDGGMQGYFSTLGASRLFGISLSSQFMNRNLFGGSEKYTLRAEVGTELGYKSGTGLIQRANNLNIQNNLSFPSFQDFMGLGKLVNKLGIIKDRFFNDFQDGCSTNIALGYNSNNIIDLYALSSFNASFGFDYTSPRNNRYIFRPLGFNLDLYNIADTARFINNPLVLLSFRDNLGTGFLFRDLTYIYNSNKLPGGNSFLIINNLELSGWEVHMTNWLYNKAFNRTDTWSLGNKSFAKYARYELDARYNKEFSKTESFAARLNIAGIVGFGENKAVPFVRQFGVGGPNSLRAWNIKEPGPGGFRDNLDKLVVPPTIHTNQGDLKLEVNAEYRFKMFYFVDGALFLDAGNVWLLNKDKDRPGAEISGNFLNQMAIGAGYGIRFNFNFFIIRFDFGYKLRNPYRDEFTGRHWYTFKEIRQQRLGNVQVAVNYPF